MVSVKLQLSLLLSSCNGDNLVHPPTYVCTHMLYNKIIIEDNIYLYATNNKLDNNFQEQVATQTST